MIIVCPDCKKKNETSIITGKQQCRKCLQFMIIDKSVVTSCIPKELINH
jgi:hypothetical protein